MIEDSLLEIAFVDIWTVNLIMNNLTGDDKELNMVAYHIQQAMEKCLKHQLELLGIKYHGIHALDELLRLDIGIKNSITIELRAELVTTAAWEAKTRYIKGYRTELSEIQSILPTVTSYLDVIKSYTSKFVVETNLFQ